MIIMDTSALIDFFRGAAEARKFLDHELATTVVTYNEIMTGVKHHRARREERFFRRFFSSVDVLDIDRESEEESSRIMADLLKLGVSVNSMDVLIAGIAIAKGAEGLATRDRDFLEIAKVSELEVLLY